LYRLIVSDMDGTLLNSYGEIPKENLKAINDAMDKGVEFAIVTGRPYAAVKGILKENKLTCSVIGCNGAQVTDKNGSLIMAHYINKDSLLQIIKKAEDENIYYQLYDDNCIYTKSRLELLKVLRNYSKKSIKRQFSINRIIRGIKRLFFAEVKVISNLQDFAASEDRNFYKLQIASLDQERLKSIKKSLENIPYINITSSAYYNIEVGPGSITKGTALKELAEIKSIPREEIIAMGDNYNDIPMLEYAGCGVAMENAETGVKDKANFYTKSNDDNGVAFAIEELIFKS